MLVRWIHLALTWRRAVAVVAVVVVAAASVASAGLQIRNDLGAFFVEGDPAVADYETFKARFGTDEVVVIDVGGDDDALSAARLQQLTELSAALSRLPGVERVLSLATVDVVITGDDGVSVIPARVAVDEARRQSRPGGPLARLVDDGGTHQRLWLWFTAAATTDHGRHETLTAINDVMAPIAAARPVRVVGGGVVWEALNALTVRDGAIFISLAAVVLFVGLLLLTRRLLWAMVAVVAVSCANTVVFAAMALSHTALNAITVCLPSLVMALSVLDLVHVVAAVDGLPDDVDDVYDARVSAALADVVTPGVFNIATTAIGLLALLTATSAVTQQLGAFAALGVVLAWVFCLLWTLVALPRVLRRRRCRTSRVGADGLSTRLARLAIARPIPVLVGAAVVVVVSVVGVGRLDVDTDTLGFLPSSHSVHQDVRAIEASVGPFIPLEVDIAVDDGREGDGSADGWQRAKLMSGVRRASAQLNGAVVAASVGDVRLGRPVSILDVLDPAATALGSPLTSDDDVAAAVAFMRASAPQLEEGLVSADRRHLRLTVPVTLTTAQGFIAASAHVRAVVDDAIAGTGASARLTGYLPLYARIVDSLVGDQIRSFTVAFVGIFVLIGVFLRSRRLMVLAALPNLLPIVGVLGVMGYVGVPLDVATITIAATILGIVVDDTVHTLFHLRKGLQHGLGPTEAIVAASRSAGRANAFGNGLLLVGFLVLTLASARSLVVVGGLSALAVAFALMADLIVLPALATVVLPVVGRGRGSAP